MSQTELHVHTLLLHIVQHHKCLFTLGCYFSLQDVLSVSDLELDVMFKLSFAYDIVNVSQFIYAACSSYCQCFSGGKIDFSFPSFRKLYFIKVDVPI